MKGARLVRAAAMAIATFLTATPVTTQAATIWTGPSITFTRPPDAEPELPANQDRITPRVWMSRNRTLGLYNGTTESEWSDKSPADTEWAYGTTSQLPSLSFKSWLDWHEKCPPCTLGRSAVLHLIAEDVYIDIVFTGWQLISGGGFSYRRSTAGGSTSPPSTASVVEFYHAGLDHYFITWVPDEIAKLDAGAEIKGWTRTGWSFPMFTAAQDGTSPVCRYYIPPALGDSHFFGRGTVECDATGEKNPSFVLEEAQFMHTILPSEGVCPAGATPVYRVFSNRADANHRYMTDRSVRNEMVAKGWLAEGDGPDQVVMCAPQ
jgi:hypothetical protein